MWSWRREPRGRELEELEELKRLLEGFVPKRKEVDRTTWTLDNLGGFSVKTLMVLLEEAGYRGSHMGTQTSWLKAVPKKVCIFMWRAKLGRLSVRVELDRRGIDIYSTICPRRE